MDKRNIKTELLEILANHGQSQDTIDYGAIRFKNHEINFEGHIRSHQLALMNREYDSGYGRQEVDGTIVFKDGTWLSRGEYDGSEWWEYNFKPSIQSVISKYQDPDKIARYKELLENDTPEHVSCIYKELLDEELIKEVYNDK